MSERSEFIIKLRGLPFSTVTRDVVDFLEPAQILNGEDGVHLTMIRPGRPTGECFVELLSEEDVELALKKDMENMGSRYIEVFHTDRQEMQWALNHTHVQNGNFNMPVGEGVVKLRGLPFGCSKQEIIDFFEGLNVSPDGITILLDNAGRSSGDAFVHFVDKESAERALDKHREKIGHRYIEVFKSSPQEMKAHMSSGGNMGTPRMMRRPTPYDRFDRFGGNGGGGGGGGGRFDNGNRMRGPPRGGGGGGSGGFQNDYNDGPNNWGGRGNSGGGGPWRQKWRPNGGGSGSESEGHCVHMRGLPFKATFGDIAYFFKPIRPLNINILFDNNNRPSGEADVEFESHDQAVRAMRKDKSMMDHRYIELFLNSSSGGGSSGGGGGGGRDFGGGYQDKFSRNNYRN